VSLRKRQGSVSEPLLAMPGSLGIAVIQRHAMRANSRRPGTHVTGFDNRMEIGYAWKWPAAQYGLQSFWLPIPVATAESGDQLFQWSFVT